MVKIFLILVCIFFVSDGLERLYKQKNACNRMSCRQIFRSTRLESSSDTADKFDMFQQAESRTGLNNNNDEILPDTSTLSAHANEYISSFVQNIKDLQGTPELVDRLENIASRYPGIEVDLELYRNLYPFPLDGFQEAGLSALIEGNNVVVSTPTGSGKTLVGELAIYFALMMGLRVAYTTPLKALSNQKFQDFKQRYGADRVGLLTGDIAINRGAPITIMTTEVFRNMVYDQDSQNQLSNLFMVVFDEFHFMNDPERGTVWEESVISCPLSVRILALSATMGNVQDIKGWISSIHGPTKLVLSDYRPVPLRYFFAMKQGLFPLFRDPNAGPGALNGVQKQEGNLVQGATINPSLTKLEDQYTRGSKDFGSTLSRDGGRSSPKAAFRGGSSNANALIPSYASITEELQLLKKLPAIVFIFSRAGCEQAAKAVSQGKMKSKLLTAEEDEYVQKAAAAFMAAHPDIPIPKSSIQMLRAGVGVHHAGLISVWKSFIEDLFNANKIKILFATETLAAGVNMPARTTVVTTVTKRINSEVVKLKTSQLLQMAGRAGRRGKDTEGTVVIMRNRFEDVKMSHKILTTAVDGIKSHFKTSYGLCVKLLETKSLDDCRALIERGFGAYLMQQRIVKKQVVQISSEAENYRSLLQKYTLVGAREYLKLVRRFDKEKKNYDFILSKMMKSENELVQAIVEYMPAGIGVQLKDGSSAFFLGEVNWRSKQKFVGYAVIKPDGQIMVARKEHIRGFADTDDCLPAKTSQTLLELVTLCTEWEELKVDSCTATLLSGYYPVNEVYNDVKMQRALDYIANKDPTGALSQSPGSILKQKNLVREIEEQLQNHPIQSIEGEGERVIEALRYVSTLKDPVAFVNEKKKESDSASAGNVFAWKRFLSVYQILQKFEALVGNDKTELGQMVGSLSSDNELWLALVLRNPAVQNLTAAEFGGVMCSVLLDGHKASNAFFKERPSDSVKEVFAQLEPIQWALQSEQNEVAIDFPVHLSMDAAGMVESWVKGITWRDLCKETSLDQGDICRMLRRTVEVLRQIPYAYGIPPKIAELAYEAADKMDRFPVADFAEASTYSGSAGIAPEAAGALLQDEEESEGGEEDSDIGGDTLFEEDSLLTVEEVQEFFGLDDDSDSVTLDSFGGFDVTEGEEDVLSSMLESME